MEWWEIVKIVLYTSGLILLLVIIYRYWQERIKAKINQPFKYIQIEELPALPFSDTVEIILNVKENIHCSLYVNDEDNQMIANLFEGELTEGLHKFEWNTRLVNNNFYYLTLKSEHQLTEKRVQIKND